MPITGAATGTFQYDGNGKRVKQVINGEEIYSVYGLSGALLYRENTTTSEKTDYVRAAGQTVARIRAGVTSYLHADHLGSPVAATTTGGAVLNSVVGRTKKNAADKVCGAFLNLFALRRLN